MGCFFVLNSTFSAVLATLKHSCNPPATSALSLQICRFCFSGWCRRYDSNGLLLTTLQITFSPFLMAWQTAPHYFGPIIHIWKTRYMYKTRTLFTNLLILIQCLGNCVRLYRLTLSLDVSCATNPLKIARSKCEAPWARPIWNVSRHIYAESVMIIQLLIHSFTFSLTDNV